MNINNFIVIIKFIFLGFVQGFTEPIPISSSGHSIIVKDILHVYTPALSFEIIVHVGSLIAICIVYRHDIIKLIKETVHFIIHRDNRFYSSFLFTFFLCIATFITGTIGLFLESFITEKLTKPIFVGVALIITGIFIWIIRHLNGHKSDKDITAKDAILIGIAQSFALIPGISRSGATVVMALLLGMNRTTALRFSFLLFIPVSIGISLLSVNDIIQDRYFTILIIPYTLAFLTSLIATYFALKWFIQIMKKGNLKIFAYYCFIIGLFVIFNQIF